MPVFRSRVVSSSALCLLLAAGFALPVQAQQPATAPATARFNTGHPSRDTLLRLSRPISVDLQDKRLEDIMTFIQTSSSADIEPLWIDDRNPDGLDKDKLVTVKVDNVTFLSLIEKVLEKGRGDGGENTWQMSETGTIQLGPKERLNKTRRVQIYDINDLLMEIPNYSEVPQIDLQRALQASQGGGGGSQSPFRDNQGQDRQQQLLRDRKERSDEIIALIQSIVEPDQWIDNGGSGASVRLFQGTLIVNGADYIHRGINGYRYWPSTATNASMVNGRRYVTLTTDSGISKLLGIAQQPVSAVVGGQIIRSNDPPGGGR